ncbi:hypothetical protein NW754_007268 [Fusarium falciforme]|nr:hypothetical protein NW754_007268 [Fusarium falciforme]KAJ4206153.1 hypothetical protein NW767_003401 [Fusarium falciforme]
MEARSLSALNNLASNPPQYPINPAQERQDPLTLYISRVPGTRDVILSPFKPQLKNVTGEDVANCLYYVHHEAPSTELVNPPPLRDDGHRSSSDDSSSMRNIPRKPLPGSARPLTPPTRDHLPVPAFGSEYQDPGRPRGLSVNSSLDAVQTKPVWPGNKHSLDEPRPDLPPRSTPVPTIQAPTSPLGRKPIGPRPMSSPATNPENDKPLPPPPGPYQAANFDHMTRASQVPGRANHSRSPSPRTSYEGKPFTLALIRRDPSTGNQWNVAHVSSIQPDGPQPDQDDSNPLFGSVPPVAQSPSNGNAPINVQIETLGYGKFRGMPARRSFDAGPGADANQPKDGGVVLQRTVAMGYTKSWASNWREKLNQEGRGHGRSGSVGSMDSAGEVQSPTEPQISMQPGPGLRPRGHIFTSPWNGRCEFRTAPSGRSLKCYHILHDDQQSFNPLANQGIGPPQASSMLVSELRFNLPTAELFKSPEGREEVKNQIQGHFNKLLKREGRSDVSYDDDGMVSPFDLNLGKEKAGGGNRGKRAKLGKLIIHPDGLKMLDLVVAANMGLWWQAWERSF